MFTNSEQYEALKSQIASFLNVDAKRIYSIENPTRKKIAGVWLVSIENSHSVMIREKDGQFVRL